MSEIKFKTASSPINAASLESRKWLSHGSQKEVEEIFRSRDENSGHEMEDPNNPTAHFQPALTSTTHQTFPTLPADRRRSLEDMEDIDSGEEGSAHGRRSPSPNSKRINSSINPKLLNQQSNRLTSYNSQLSYNPSTKGFQSLAYNQSLASPVKRDKFNSNAYKGVRNEGGFSFSKG